MFTLSETNLLLPLFCRGKVRDTYDLGDKLLIIATDRISAFDSVLPSVIPDKGAVLNQLSAFWFHWSSQLVPNHLVDVPNSLPALQSYFPEGVTIPLYLIGRTMVVRKAERIPLECVVRGYLAGSAWAEYKETGSVYGASLPRDMKESQELPEPLFTPTTKEETGHDRPLSEAEVVQTVGESLARELKEKTLTLYSNARDYARNRGIIIADTKFEFGLLEDKVILIDELLTPDSSRFWDASRYTPGHSQPSYDKQPVRDWLIGSGWDKEPPAPELPQEIIEQTSQRYREAYHKLTGKILQ